MNIDSDRNSEQNKTLMQKKKKLNPISLFMYDSGKQIKKVFVSHTGMRMPTPRFSWKILIYKNTK